ncbi:MAG: L,D-transpeptidase family protein [Candidatus Methylumidiphilus sp.]
MEIPNTYLRVNIAEQRMDWLEADNIVRSYLVSTAKNGPGEIQGSGCTPRGWLSIRAKIGAGAPLGAVFVGRRWTGEIHDAGLQAQYPERDWILTRILWLDGLQPGFNRYGTVHTASRYIYIHGSPDAGVSGVPASHGCIRMKSGDVLDLFDRVKVGMKVLVLA